MHRKTKEPKENNRQPGSLRLSRKGSKRALEITLGATLAPDVSKTFPTASGHPFPRRILNPSG